MQNYLFPGLLAVAACAAPPKEEPILWPGSIHELLHEENIETALVTYNGRRNFGEDFKKALEEALGDENITLRDCSNGGVIASLLVTSNDSMDRTPYSGQFDALFYCAAPGEFRKDEAGVPRLVSQARSDLLQVQDVYRNFSGHIGQVYAVDRIFVQAIQQKK